MVRNPRIAGTVFSGAAWYLAAYLLIQFSGLFGPPPAGIMRVLHKWPALAGVIVLMLGSATGLIMLIRASGAGTERRAGILTRLTLHCGVLFLGIGILLSSLTRFEGRLALSEGQGINTAKGEFDPSTLYTRKFSRWPHEDLAMLEVAPFISEKGMAREGTQTRIVYRDAAVQKGREVTLDTRLPRLIHGFFYRIGDKGYSVLYSLFGGNGDIVDQAYVVLKIFPPGAEDSFRIYQIPHTFYLRYYPDASSIPDKINIPQGKTGPLFKVRIARNLDIVTDGYFSPGDVVPVDSLHAAFGQERRWVEIRIVRDPGLYLMVPGLIMMAAGGLFMTVGKVRRTEKE